jgi:23S rRNA pseudouridine1911/1915/1917 synthase
MPVQLSAASAPDRAAPQERAQPAGPQERAQPAGPQERAQPAGPQERAQPAGPLRTLYEDEHLLAVDKPAGLVVHPAYRHPDGTLYDLVAARYDALGAPRPWLLHRLDRDTSGVVLFARTERARQSVVAQFERHQVRKWYLALVPGRVDPPLGTIDQPLRRDPADRRRVVVDTAGQPSTSDYVTVAASEQRALLLVQPRTGRTHQIRAHLAWLGHPLVGDAIYQASDAHVTAEAAVARADRQMLHAWCLCVRHPVNGNWTQLQAPVAEDLRALLPADWLAGAEAALRAHALS